ncbi:hypothetical protein WL28_23000 [Burkholderia ubonensis]|nr:hypothetical protein WL28_23000 [Burkholderia ubonensis]
MATSRCRCSSSCSLHACASASTTPLRRNTSRKQTGQTAPPHSRASRKPPGFPAGTSLRRSRCRARRPSEETLHRTSTRARAPSTHRQADVLCCRYKGERFNVKFDFDYGVFVDRIGALSADDMTAIVRWLAMINEEA